METDEQPSSQSPIISQYAIHLQRQASASLNTPLQTTPNESPPRTPTPFSSPGRVETIHTPTVHGLFDHNHTTVHTSPDHNPNSEMIPPDENTTNTIPEDDIQTTPAPEEPNQPIVPPHPHRHLSNRPEPKSVIYDKSDHPNSPEIHHILCHGLRIYDPISPDPPLSNPPIFDSTIGPSSAPDIPLRLSPLPFTPLTSPAKSNDSGLGFLSHTATHNDFAATASTSPPVIGRPTIVPSPADEVSFFPSLCPLPHSQFLCVHPVNYMLLCKYYSLRVMMRQLSTSHRQKTPRGTFYLWKRTIWPKNYSVVHLFLL